MIAITVVAAVVMHTWVNTMVTNQARQSQTAIRIEQVQFDSVTIGGTDYNYIKIAIRNTGTVGVVIKTVYVYKGDTQIWKFDSVDVAFSAGDLKEVGFTNALNWGSSKLSVPDIEKPILPITFGDLRLEKASAYVIKIVTDIGFSVEGTYYTPNKW